MKMKTGTLMAFVICVIGVVTMSGCIDSGDSKTPITDIINIPTEVKTVYNVDLILGHNLGSGVMEVEMYDDNTATITTTTGSGETVETGKWRFYRKSADHEMYDVTTDKTELRLAFGNSAHAIAYIYENGFTKCGEPFHGVWEKPVVLIIPSGSSTTENYKNLIFYLDVNQITEDPNDKDIIRTTLLKDGTVDVGVGLVTYDDYTTGTWKLISAATYNIELDHSNDMEVRMLADGTTEVTMEDVPWVLEGEWKR